MGQGIWVKEYGSRNTSQGIQVKNEPEVLKNGKKFWSSIVIRLMF